MNEENITKKKKSSFLKKIKKIKLRHFIILGIFLLADTYAWFVYVNTVSNKVDVHIRSWKIDFKDGDTPIVDYVNVVADNVYPGMPTFQNTIKAFNYSEVLANAEFTVLEANIMGTRYITTEGRTDAGQSVQSGDLTSNQLKTKLLNDYPFHISFNISSETMEAQTGLALFTTQITWPYESGNDELDTYWGTTAYTFIHQNPSTPCIELKVKIYIAQASN